MKYKVEEMCFFIECAKDNIGTMYDWINVQGTGQFVIKCLVDSDA